MQSLFLTVAKPGAEKKQLGYLRRVEDYDQDGEDTQFEPSDELTGPEKTMAILVDEDVITADLLDSMAEAARKVQLPSGGLKPSEWSIMAAELRETNTLSPQHLKDIKSFAKDVRGYHSRLHQDFAASDYKDRKISNELEDVHVFLTQFEEPRRKYLETASKVAVEALSGASFGPSAAVAAYVAWAQPSRDDTIALLGELEQLHDGDSPLIVGGNKVQPVHQDELWKAKMTLLDEALTAADAGNPPEINAQYFELTSDEFVSKLANCARAGCKVRVNIDPSRPGTNGQYGVSVDDGPRKLRALLQLSAIPDSDVGISLYPVNDELGSLSNLMHRKILRVGEKVLLSGMNANKGSGENVDAGYIIEGPAARRLVENFKRDVDTSLHAGLEKVYGADNADTLMNGDVTLTPFGLEYLLDALVGESPAGACLNPDPTYEHVDQLAEKAGYKFWQLIDMKKDEIEQIMAQASSSRRKLPLSKKGKEVLSNLMEKVFEQTRTSENIQALEDITAPEGKAVGATRVGIGDLPTEREALLLHAISTAEEFIYVPTFVITRAVARAMAARREELKAQGKDLDIRVIADAGIYPYGGTPNEHGVTALEDAGVKVRWSLLPRSTRDHDRKIHAKQVITDKMEFFGSTNLSVKGLKDNWEVSGVVLFDESDQGSLEAREKSKAQFLKLWDYESFELDTRRIAEKRLADCKTKDREMRIEEARRSAIKSVLSRIRIYEMESADWMQEQAKDPRVAERAQQLELSGMAEGYALLRAVEEVLGTEEFYKQLNGLDGMKQLRTLRREG